MATINHLPLEILATIFSHTRRPLNWGRTYQSDLCCAALVCRGWSRLAQMEIYQDMVLQPDVNLEAFLANGWTANLRTSKLNLRTQTREDLALVLERCNGVEELAIWLDPSEWVVLASGAPSLAGLKCLTIKSVYSDIYNDPSPPIPLSFHLSFLSIDFVTENSAAPAPEFLEACFKTLCSSPTTLKLRCVDSNESFRSLAPHFPLIANTLHTFSITLDSDVIDSLGKFFPTLNNLYTFVIDMRPQDGSEDDMRTDEEIGQALVTLKDFLPPKVQVIKIINHLPSHLPFIEILISELPISGRPKVFSVMDSRQSSLDEQALAKEKLEKLGVDIL